MLPLRDRLPSQRFPFVTYAILGLNILAFFHERAALDASANPLEWIYSYALVPRLLLADPVGSAPTIFTSMFLHDPSGWAHLLGNMLYVWIFADNVEDALGHGRFLLLYLASGVGAAALQVFFNPTSMVPMLGASGAISGVLAAYVVLYPLSPITVLNPIFLLWFFFGIFLELPAWLIIGEYFVVNTWMALTRSSAEGGVAFLAHVGGFLTGWLLTRTVFRHLHRVAYERWHGFRANEIRRRRREDEDW